MTSNRVPSANARPGRALRFWVGLALAVGVTVAWTWPLAAGIGRELPLDPAFRDSARAPMHLHLFELGETLKTLSRGDLPDRWEGVRAPLGQARDVPNTLVAALNLLGNEVHMVYKHSLVFT